MSNRSGQQLCTLGRTAGPSGATHTLADLANEELEPYELSFQQVRNDRAGGAQLVYTMLQTGDLVVADTCQNVIRAIESRVHDKKEPLKVEKAVGDPYDDVCDALRYALYSHHEPEKKPLEMRVQDRPTLSAFSPQPSFLPTAHAEQRRFSFCLRPKLCAWVSVPDLSPLPILPSAPAPFSGVKLTILFASFGVCSGTVPYCSKIQLLKLLGLTSLTVTVFRCAPREAPEAHPLDLPFLPPSNVKMNSPLLQARCAPILPGFLPVADV